MTHWHILAGLLHHFSPSGKLNGYTRAMLRSVIANTEVGKGLLALDRHRDSVVGRCRPVCTKGPPTALCSCQRSSLQSSTPQVGD